MDWIGVPVSAIIVVVTFTMFVQGGVEGNPLGSLVVSLLWLCMSLIAILAENKKQFLSPLSTPGAAAERSPEIVTCEGRIEFLKLTTFGTFLPDGYTAQTGNALPSRRMAQMGSAFEILRAYLQDRAAFTDEEFDFIQPMFVPRTLGSGETLQRAGEVAQHAAFITRGCLRSYLIDPKGKEHIVQFAPENWWLADNISLTEGTPSQYFIDSIEDSEVLLIDPTSHEQLVERIPGYADAFRKGLQRRAAAREERIVNTMSKSAEERYLDFLATYPSIVTRVPQWMLASYLGVSPETVSRIRKKLSRKSRL